MGADGGEPLQNGAGADDESMPPNEARALTAGEKPPELMEKTANGETEVDVEGVDSGAPEFCGLTKEELMRYANDPFWVRLRWVLLAVFWLIWLAMLVVAVVIVVLGPKCAPVQKLDWWQKDTIYQIYPRSFSDDSGDGVGDVAGIRTKLDYLKDLGVRSLWLSPIYKSPMRDFGYDISDFRAVDPLFGTMEDFDGLLADAKERDMHLIMDFVPNHSSDQHDWFQRSVRREDNYTDFYIWADGVGGGPPNGWQSVFGGSAWTYNAARGQYYYHQFLPQQPDLNFRNPNVVKEMDDVIRFWLDKGVDGFRLDALKHLFETEDLTATEPRLPNTTDSDWGAFNHTGVTTDLPETFDVLSGWRSICQEFEDKDGEHRLLMAEVYGETSRLMQYYGNGTDMADFPFNFLLVERLKSSADLTGTSLQSAIDEWRHAQPNDTWANWVLGNHDQPRVASRVGEEAADALNMLLLLLPGTPVTYYGEELAMTDAEIAPPQRQDKAGRDPQRTPMQWNAEAHAGFSAAEPWLPVNSNYREVNVETQLAADTSHLKVYRALQKLRSGAGAESLTAGDYTELVVSDKIFSFMRLRSGNPGYAVIINTSDQTLSADLTQAGSKQLADEGTVAVRSSQATSEATGVGTRVQFKAVPLGPREGIVLSFVPKAAS
ncbi:Maltase 1 [Amphibalanus amphitrite]|uniref:alpha-glucosidase n=1 Tax=Amphibalanus amphitrite TaxID=1232801 RepID=A0A6A4W8Z7_AMPAM|nr:Maltase 1 [Amphibalanus amphitrite]